MKMDAPAAGRSLTQIFHYFSEASGPAGTKAPAVTRLAAFAAPDRRGIGRRRRRSGVRRCTGIILPVVEISVHRSVLVAVGPDRAGEAADGSADHRALEDADAGNDRAGNRAERRAAQRAGAAPARTLWVFGL